MGEASSSMGKMNGFVPRCLALTLLGSLIISVACSPLSDVIKRIQDTKRGIVSSHAPTSEKKALLSNLEHIAEDEVLLQKAKTASQKHRLEEAIKMREEALASYALKHTEESSQDKPQHSSSQHDELKTEQIFHAGSDIELLRQKLAESSLDEKQKAKHMTKLIDLEKTLSEMSTTHNSARNKQLAAQLRSGMNEVHEIAHELQQSEHKQSLSRFQPTDLKLVQATVNKIKKAGGLKTDELKNLAAFSFDLEMLQGSADPEENADLVEAITLRLPAVQALAHQLQEKERLAHDAVDLEMDSDSTKDQSSELVAKGVSVLKEAKDTLSNSKLSSSKKAKYSENIDSMIKELKEAPTATNENQLKIASDLHSHVQTLKQLHKEIDEAKKLFPATKTEAKKQDSVDAEEDNNKSADHNDDVDNADVESNSSKTADVDSAVVAATATGEEESKQSSVEAKAEPDVDQAEEVTASNNVEETKADKNDSDKLASDSSLEEASSGDKAQDVIDTEEQDIKSVATESLSKLDELKAAVNSASLNASEREQFLSNLDGLEKDTKALEDPALNDAQKADLESAMKLRIALLQDMEKTLAKKN